LFVGIPSMCNHESLELCHYHYQIKPWPLIMGQHSTHFPTRAASKLWRQRLSWMIMYNNRPSVTRLLHNFFAQTNIWPNMKNVWSKLWCAIRPIYSLELELLETCSSGLFLFLRENLWERVASIFLTTFLLWSCSSHCRRCHMVVSSYRYIHIFTYKWWGVKMDLWTKFEISCCNTCVNFLGNFSHPEL
jgi:hypothetical protein